MNRTPSLLLPFFFVFLAASPTFAAFQVATYEGLLRAIREIRVASQARIEAAVEQEKVREAWETGKLIQEHILFNKDRADYGAHVMLRLSDDLGISYSELKRMREFARTYPISAPGRQLSWGHYKALLAVNDAKQREAIAEESEKNDWARDTLSEEIKKRRLSTEDAPQSQLTEIKPGTLNTYQIFKQEGRLRIDLGFDTYFDLPQEYEKKVKEGEIVTLQDLLKPKRVTVNELYTYKAKVVQVFDGDTFYALIDLGFGITLYQRLRLRRLNAPEIVSADGKKAKEFLEKVLSRNKGRILAKISKTDDQYGRYLVDVWVDDKNIDQELLDAEVFTMRGDA